MNKPQRFRKRPVEVEAMQWDGTAEGAIPILQWIDDNGATANYRCVDLNDAKMCDGGDAPHTIAINTLEGTMHANGGDWIIRGVAHEFYPCKPAIFESTYEPVEATTDAR